MLLDQQQRQIVLALQAFEPGEQTIDDHWSQAFERLVHQQQRRVAHQCAADRQHLLLAARQLIAVIAAALGKRREEVVDFRQRPLPRALGDRQILLDRQRRKYLALLRDKADAEPRAPVRRQHCDLLVGEADSTPVQSGMTRDGGEQGRLADPVTP